MNLSKALRLEEFSTLTLPPVIALAGSGGKTTALFQLARQWLASTSDHPTAIIITTTTHLHIDQARLADFHSIVTTSEFPSIFESELHGVVLISGPVVGNRLAGLDNHSLDGLYKFCCAQHLPLLIEADGSRQRPLKAPAEHEPLIPEFVDIVVVVAGMSGIGKPLSEDVVHRSQIFSRLGGLKPGEEITPPALMRVLSHPMGGLKGIPVTARRVLLLNQADTPTLQAQAKAMAAVLLQDYDAVLSSTLQESEVHAVFEPLAGIILAAGQAERFGSPKQLLDLQGKPFIVHVTEAALTARLSPLVVVTGANGEAVEQAVQHLPVKILHNPDWQAGQSSSLQAGLRTVAPPACLRVNSGSAAAGRGAPGGVIFLLADQPMQGPAILLALGAEHARNLAPIIAPLVEGQRANPVLFDRLTFPQLMTLRGDVGGRAIFPKFPVSWLPWHDDNLLMDIDTPEDYRKLIEGTKQ